MLLCQTNSFRTLKALSNLLSGWIFIINNKSRMQLFLKNWNLMRIYCDTNYLQIFPSLGRNATLICVMNQESNRTQGKKMCCWHKTLNFVWVRSLIGFLWLYDFFMHSFVISFNSPCSNKIFIQMLKFRWYSASDIYFRNIIRLCHHILYEFSVTTLSFQDYEMTIFQFFHRHHISHREFSYYINSNIINVLFFHTWIFKIFTIYYFK